MDLERIYVDIGDADDRVAARGNAGDLGRGNTDDYASLMFERVVGTGIDLDHQGALADNCADCLQLRLRAGGKPELMVGQLVELQIEWPDNA
ncbi:hypothetical protein EHF44_01055 (plasmid) [Cupriavidus pauculus]|uniref:Uncharacterized protein n=2 Tax=Cupriavidus TaxID=106589 RepID=A0A3G8GV17_9BURK|nr:MULTISPECIES: hypothetical protein [Cupriavidus]AZG12098.1 hypothetical protein EHF44_01055 [Cupriavidus pauculus]QBP14387.1 hypothetical protein DDF84_032205 [Cupriavidus metallidurans]